ncbi:MULTISPECIES: fumarylacetoacetate hydrolase family protein [unclassified Microbacterium]|uniref:fumarylacetoacetate hydrolase family protein n=1 Tax=unclassified Microbacterium TaxID=2609290 RepID=UPI000C2C487D|nr:MULTISPECIES: fumarylacetoacetate hydrolase family protein [unclassified Microbacterium]
MRFVTYASSDGDNRVGVIADAVVHGLDSGPSMVDLLDAGELQTQGERALRRPAEVVELDKALLRSPLQPRSIRDCAGFLQHLRNVSSAIDMPVDERFETFPPAYFTNPDVRFGPRDDVPMAPDTEMFDFELEIAAVIGRVGCDIPLADAESHIAGFMVYCDWSSRDLQMKEMPLRLGPGKGKDTANTLGPALVTPDEIEPFRSGAGYDLEMTVRVDDELVSHGRWSSIDWGFADMIAFASRGTRLRPGDVIGSGTVESGCLFEQYVTDRQNFRGWLQPGDDVRLAVEQLGELRHRVVAAPTAERLSTGY